MHVDNKRIRDGLWRTERTCIDPKAGDADWWIKLWEELQLLRLKEILVEVEHVKAHRTKKKEEKSQFEKVVTESNEKADELARAVVMLDEGYIAEARTKAVQQERERMYMLPCSLQRDFIGWWRNGEIVKN